jgi:hypothetical protein
MNDRMQALIREREGYRWMLEDKHGERARELKRRLSIVEAEIHREQSREHTRGNDMRSHYKPPTIEETLEQCRAKGWEPRPGELLFYCPGCDGDFEILVSPGRKQVESRVVASRPLTSHESRATGDDPC